MKRIIAACLKQTVHFQQKEGLSPEEAGEQVRQEYAFYKAQLDRRRVPYKILEEQEQPDGALIIKLKRQNSTQPVGSYLD